MKKIVAVVCTLVLLGSTFAVAAPGFAGKKITSQIVDAKQSSKTVEVAGSKIFVPKGQTVLLGQRENGAIVVRGRNLKDVKLNNASLSSKGNTVLSYYPSSNIAFLHRGDWMTISDPFGNSATVEQDGAISTQNATINSNTVATLKEQAKAETEQVAQELGETMKLPDFVAATASSPDAYEQATQNVEDTLSPSAPR